MIPKTGNCLSDKDAFHVIGTMSGTSLDGLDIVFCRFNKSENGWIYKILSCITIPYNNDWKKRLSQADQLNGTGLINLDHKFGTLIAESILTFLNNSPIKVDLIASHGHTVFHNPDEGFTYQIGNGVRVATITGITTVADFRTADVALGGQGAPLVPVGDELLFGRYDYCLNLGGFANISFRKRNKRIAFDICPVNIILNHLANCLGEPFDRDGSLGRDSEADPDLLQKLNEIPYYLKTGPKSLSKEWLMSYFIPLLDQSDKSTAEQLRTVYEHIAYQIGSVIGNHKQKTVLVSGGGTYNKLLIELIRLYTNSQFIIPESQIIEYKEALVFALLGLLRCRNEINCYASVTGATRDSSCGVIFTG